MKHEDPSLESTSEDNTIPRLPRGRLFGRMAMVDLFRIGMFSITLFAILTLRKPCAAGVSGFFETFDPKQQESELVEPDVEYRELTDEEIRERFPSVEPEADKPARP